MSWDVEMKGKSIYKVPEGKLLKVFLDFDENKINNIKLTGDFFLHPENGIELIEKALTGKGFNRELLIDEINTVVDENKIEFFGITSEAVVEAIFLARGGEKCS